MADHVGRRTPDIAALLRSAKAGDRNAFERLAEPHRRELHLHCYRMLGSFHDAEDLVQDALVRAWRGIEGFEARGSFRGWLYRIATNACLNALAGLRRRPRLLPEEAGPPTDQMPQPVPATDIAWLDPYPDAALEGVPDAAPGPEARYEMREAVQLAFVAAIQHLPPRQRAVLLLHDVLGWSEAETAQLLDTSVPSVSSALQRARATLERRLPGGRPGTASPPHDQQRALLDKYVRAWESADVDGLVSLLREDAIMSMPPWPQWYQGREAVGRFFAFACRPGGIGPFRLVPTAANRQPAFAFYCHGRQPEWKFHSVQLVAMQGQSIVALTSFVEQQINEVFGLPAVLVGRNDKMRPPDHA